jgi:hypothetical protein
MNWIKKVEELGDKLDKGLEKEAELLIAAKSKENLDRKHKINRDGEEKEIAERVLWAEVGFGSPTAIAKLKEIHPALFKQVDENGEIANEINVISKEALGFSPSEMTPHRQIKLIKLMVEELYGKEKK